jgi:hypothetical protein
VLIPEGAFIKLFGKSICSEKGFLFGFFVFLNLLASPHWMGGYVVKPVP